MAVIMLERLVSNYWILEPGEVVEWLTPMKEAAWIAAGYADYWSEDDERVYQVALKNLNDNS